MKYILLLISALLLSLTVVGSATTSLAVKNKHIEIRWALGDQGWEISSVMHNSGQSFGIPNGAYTLIYSDEIPSIEPETIINRDGDTMNFDIARFYYIEKEFNKSISEVPMNRAGEAVRFFPEKGWQEGSKVCFEKSMEIGTLRTEWSADPEHHSDIVVKTIFIPNKDGYYSIATPSIAVVPEQRLGWSVVPGFFQGDYIQPKFHLSYMYGQGLPHLPVICNDNTVTTMITSVTEKAGLTLSLMPAEGYSRLEYLGSKRTHGVVWKCGLSHMNREGELTPTLYYPVLGQDGSMMNKGDVSIFEFRVSITDQGWYEAHKHAAYDIYGLKKSLSLRKTTMPLYKRMEAIWDYTLDDTLSFWRTEEFKGIKIGAQAYLGGVVEADGDAMKNSDIGAAWMLASMTTDPRLTQERLPFMRNFKLMQQASADDPNHGAAMGQYYLSKKEKFVEEWGDHIEPIGITYYTLMDIGNILLFEPNDEPLRESFRAGAEKLLSLQFPDGGFVMAYDRTNKQPLFTDLTDLRPTFYGFIIAYRILGDDKYLDAAIKGADWFVMNATEKGAFTGVCGDARFINDFATAQAVQALIDMYDITQQKKYIEAAVETAKMYTCSIYTHSKSNVQNIEYKGIDMQQWQISQVGLCFEHGGCAGSAVRSGPILLTSHCGMFIRLYEETGDTFFRDLARAAATAREAHLSPETSIATYYWSQFDRGPGPFPHHAWWQLGWIADYIFAEAEMRSGHKIDFPRGFMTPKVGPQRIFGFEAGDVYGDKASPAIIKGLFDIDNNDIEVLTALSVDGKSLYVILLNSTAKSQKCSLKINRKTIKGRTVDVESASYAETGKSLKGKGIYSINMGEYGIETLKFKIR